MGVFATRSPYRPNPIGLSSVKLVGIEHTKNEGDVLIVSGADLLDGTPIYDIKPYIPYTDCHSDAVGGFSEGVFDDNLKVYIPDELKKIVDERDVDLMTDILAGDPRPHYQNDEDRVYAFEFSKYHIEFKVSDQLLTVVNITIAG
jgi:hypothetical protein